jgi:hypothetical protein
MSQLNTSALGLLANQGSRARATGVPQPPANVTPLGMIGRSSQLTQARQLDNLLTSLTQASTSAFRTISQANTVDKGLGADHAILQSMEQMAFVEEGLLPDLTVRDPKTGLLRPVEDVQADLERLAGDITGPISNGYTQGFVPTFTRRMYAGLLQRDQAQLESRMLSDTTHMQVGLGADLANAGMELEQIGMGMEDEQALSSYDFAFPGGEVSFMGQKFQLSPDLTVSDMEDMVSTMYLTARFEEIDEDLAARYPMLSDEERLEMGLKGVLIPAIRTLTQNGDFRFAGEISDILDNLGATPDIRDDFMSSMQPILAMQFQAGVLRATVDDDTGAPQFTLPANVPGGTMTVSGVEELRQEALERLPKPGRQASPFDLTPAQVRTVLSSIPESDEVLQRVGGILQGSGGFVSGTNDEEKAITLALKNGGGLGSDGSIQDGESIAESIIRLNMVPRDVLRSLRAGLTRPDGQGRASSFETILRLGLVEEGTVMHRRLLASLTQGDNAVMPGGMSVTFSTELDKLRRAVGSPDFDDQFQSSITTLQTAFTQQERIPTRDRQTVITELEKEDYYDEGYRVQVLKLATSVLQGSEEGDLTKLGDVAVNMFDLSMEMPSSGFLGDIPRMFKSAVDQSALADPQVQQFVSDNFADTYEMLGSNPKFAADPADRRVEAMTRTINQLQDGFDFAIWGPDADQRRIIPAGGNFANRWTTPARNQVRAAEMWNRAVYNLADPDALTLFQEYFQNNGGDANIDWSEVYPGPFMDTANGGGYMMLDVNGNYLVDPKTDTFLLYSPNQIDLTLRNKDDPQGLGGYLGN